MKNKILFSALTVVLVLVQSNAYSFCGFYVATAGAKIFNETSQVILVRDGNSSTITMSNDFKGDAKNFAMVVPVPVVLRENDITTVSPQVFNTLDNYSGPRLVEYFDENPCVVEEILTRNFGRRKMKIPMTALSDEVVESAQDNGVTIEAIYEVDEYDILILSAKESEGLKIWLTDNDYQIPESAAEVLDPYIKNNLKFFVVKVDIERLAQTGSKMLNPLQIRFDSPKFMLPIRLGMANAQGAQDMIVYALSKEGRIECTNYRTVKIPTDKNIPTFVRNDFGHFYKDLFDREYDRQGKNCVFLEYAWNVTPSWGGMKCDPCVGPPPITGDLASAGVRWTGNVQFTRLHVRYTREKFAQDLLFQVTPNKENFQARYIITNPANGTFDCNAGQDYLVSLVNRRERELDELQVLAGWNPDDRPYYVDSYRGMIKDDSRKNKVIVPVPVNGPNGIPLGKLLFTLLIAITALSLIGKGIYNQLRPNPQIL